MVVLGLFDSGHYEFDAGYAYLNIVDAQRLFRLTGPTGIRLRLDDYNRARAVAVSVSSALGPNYWVSDWTRQNRNWFAAVQVEKRLMAIILTLIVAVAAFNLVSTLVMTVNESVSWFSYTFVPRRVCITSVRSAPGGTTKRACVLPAGTANPLYCTAVVA